MANDIKNIKDEKEDIQVSLPGDILGTEEEYIPGDGTYVDKEGQIRALLAGIVVSDEQRRISVISEKYPEKLKVGDVVYGRVEELFESVAFLTIEHPKSENLERVERTSAIVPLSEISEKYLRSIRDAIHVGDLVVGIVKEITPLAVIVTLKPKGMGVVMAYCSYDRKPMIRKGNYVVCSQCGQKEERKLADNYGKFEYLGRMDLETPHIARLQRLERIEKRGRKPELKRYSLKFQKRRSFTYKRTRF